MSAWAWVATLVVLLTTASTRADEHARLRVSVEDCAEPRIDGSELAARIALELGDAYGEARIDVVVRAPCSSTTTDMRVSHAGRVVMRTVDLGTAEGLGRTWALALLAAELVREASEALPPPTAIGVGPSEAETVDAAALPFEPVAQRADEVAADARPVAEIPRAWWSAGALGRLYLELPTMLAGLELAVSHDFWRVALAALGTEVGSRLGSIRAFAATLELAVRPLAHREGVLHVAGELSASLGFAHAVGDPRGSGARGSESVDVLAGLGAALRIGLRASRDGTLEFMLGFGYDAWGATYASSEQPLARVHGARLDLALSLAFAP
jgi:hypothetical protein